MQASVPELVKRTISMLGTASITICARMFSSGLGAPKLVPLERVARRAERTSSWAWPTMAGPHEPT